MQLNTKRRRLNDASSALSKPFKSPLRKQPVADEPSNARKEGTEPEQTIVDSEPTSITASSSSLTTGHSQPDNKSPLKPPYTPQRNLDFSSHHLSPIAPSQSSSSSSSSSTLITALRKQESALLSRLVSLHRELDTVSQALKIEQKGQDDELAELITKWKGVSREAAEELFVGARDKVNGMGGVGAWKEKARDAKMRRMEWDSEEMGQGKRNDEDECEDVDDERGKRRREIEEEIRAGEADNNGAQGDGEESDGDGDEEVLLSYFFFPLLLFS